MTTPQERIERHALRMITMYATSQKEQLFYLNEFAKEIKKRTLAFVREEVDKINMERRIDDEFRKYNNQETELNWSKLAESKIKLEILNKLGEMGK